MVDRSCGWHRRPCLQVHEQRSAGWARSPSLQQIAQGIVCPGRATNYWMAIEWIDLCPAGLNDATNGESTMYENPRAA
jgi:hypothetical protein